MNKLSSASRRAGAGVSVLLLALAGALAGCNKRAPDTPPTPTTSNSPMSSTPMSTPGATGSTPSPSTSSTSPDSTTAPTGGTSSPPGSASAADPSASAVGR